MDNTTNLNVDIRDWFASQALHQFSLSDLEVFRLQHGTRPDFELIARFCYDTADAMMAERAKRQKRD